MMFEKLPTLLLIVFWITRTAAGQETVEPTAVAPQTVPLLDVSAFPDEGRDYRVAETPRHVQPLLMRLILDNIPHTYDNEKKWGGQKEVFHGLDIRTDGLRIRTKRRKKAVNHGTWKRYGVTLIEPKKNLRVRITDVREEELGHAVFKLMLTAKLAATGRVQEWNRGIRLFSISADALADVDLSLTCQMTTELDATNLPPDILLKPQVTEAQLQLRSFQLQRVSKADGPVIRELGDGLENIIRKKLAEKNDRLVAKINRQIVKHEDELRLSMRELVTSGIFRLPREADSQPDD